MPAFTLNSAVDVLLKKEFDVYRSKQEPHPLMILHGIEAVPLRHPSLDDWRDNRKGVQATDRNAHFLFFGSIDDLWMNTDRHIHVVDYKSTSIEGQVSLEGEWKDAYKRQVSMYQWLLRKNGLPISNNAFFVYVNGDKKQPAFNDVLHFHSTIIPYEGNDSWVDDALEEAHECLSRSAAPAPSMKCEWCDYRKNALEADRASF